MPRSIIALAGIVLFGLVLRIAWIGAIDPAEFPRSIPTGGRADPNHLGYDGVRYDSIAVNLLQNGTFGYHPGRPDAWRPPGYPFFLYATYLVCGREFAVVRVFQALMGAGLIVLVYAISRQWTGSAPASLLAALLMAWSYDSILFTGIFYSEPLCSLASMLGIYLLGGGLTARPVRWAAVAGGYAALAAAAMVRPGSLIFFALALVLGALSTGRDWKTAGKIVLLAALAFSALVLPWTWRNHRIHGKWLLISSNGGQVFFLANHPRSYGSFVPEPGRYTPEQERELKAPGVDAVEQNKIHYRYGMKFIRDDPGRFFGLVFRKQRFLWTHGETQSRWFDFLGASPVPLLVFNFLVLLSLPGLAAALGNFRACRWLLVYLASQCLVVSVFFYYHGPRTRIELLPPLCILAGAGLVRLANLVRGRWTTGGVEKTA